MTERHPKDITADERHAGLRVLRRFHEGTLQFQERVSQVQFVIESASGLLVMPVEPALAEQGPGAGTMLLWMPAESDWDAQASVTLRPIARPESEEAVDRWRAYHGVTSDTVWVRGEVEGLKTRHAVFLGEDVKSSNPLGRGEYGLIRRANADRDVLASACKKHAATPVADPLCVGVDPFGLDVRARFGIIRLEFPDGIEASTPETCEREVMRLLAAGGPPTPARPEVKR